jgi:hypothetical protein
MCETTMIFLSHTHTDKPVVEPVALQLREIFGTQNVFYDSWSIQPGDGIIDKMNEGLTAPDFVFFFVSAASLLSGMVKIEWQNALYKASSGKTRIIPVRVDGAAMPAVLSQNLYIDMYTQGIAVAVQQIVNLVQGNNSFTPQHGSFANLTWKTQQLTDTQGLEVIVSASHLFEPMAHVLILSDNTDKDAELDPNPVPFVGGFNPDVTLTNGIKTNAFSYAPMTGGGISPKNQLRIRLLQKGSTPLQVRGVLHKEGDQYIPLPQKLS